MWHRPQLMTVIADLLLAAAAAALLVAAALWATRLPLFPLREAVVVSELREVQRKDIERALNGLLRGNFFSVNLDALRASLEKLPWVRHAELRRQWPSRLEIVIEEHRPAAYWGEGGGQLVNDFGEVSPRLTATTRSCRSCRGRRERRRRPCAAMPNSPAVWHRPAGGRWPSICRRGWRGRCGWTTAC